MAYRTRSLSKYRKAQFFFLSAFTIVTILYFISQWISPYSIPDTSTVAMMEEPYIFNNVKEKAVFAVNGTKSCEDLRYNLEEYKYFVERYAFEKNIKLDFNYVISPCFSEPPLFPVVVNINMQLRSPSLDLGSNFTMGWVPS